VHKGEVEMYKFKDNQINFSDFGQPVGMKMNPNNRWVKKAELIPWGEIEKQYAKLFTNQKGNVAKPLRLALGACIIQAEYEYSDEETTHQIQEAPYLQFFCGFAEYKDEPPFDSSLMVYFRKRLTPEILGEINELIIRKAQEKPKTDKDDDDKPEPPCNKGTLIVDATCAPSQIKYPQDTGILNEARENTERIISELHTPADGKRPRIYAKRAHKDYLSFARKKKKSAKEIRKSVGKQLRYLRRNLNIIDNMLVNGKELSTKKEIRLQTIKAVYDQQKYMFDNRTHSVENRIVSLSQPYIRPIVRGKAKSPVEFGAKLDISVADGFVRLEKQSFDAYNEATVLKEVIERYKARTGNYPERVLADKIYRNRDNLTWCKEYGIRLSGPALGRPKKDVIIDKKLEYKDNCDRVEVERDFSLAKRKCGLGQIYTRLQETSQSVIALSIVVLNLRKVLCAFFQHCWVWFVEFLVDKKSVFVQ
jgi:IS5 family transposase